jgi:hypothetical protein
MSERAPIRGAERKDRIPGTAGTGNSPRKYNENISFRENLPKENNLPARTYIGHNKFRYKVPPGIYKFVQKPNLPPMYRYFGHPSSSNI